MAMFNTGNAQWDQGLNSLGSSLFPDPSKIAQAGYYGAEARKAQMDAASKAGQMNALAYGIPASLGGQPPSAPNFQPVTAVPNSNAVMLAPPSSNLSGVFTGQPLPPNGPPAPGLPPAPNTTASDGSVPPATPQDGTGILHPNAITPSDGGMKVSGPAQHDGSPAPVPNFSAVATYLAAGGMDANSVTNALKALNTQAYNNGNIDYQHYKMNDASLGSGTMFKEDAATGRTIIQEAGATGRQNIVTGETKREFNLTPQTGVDAEGRPTMVLPQDIISGQRRFEPNVYTTDQGTVTTGGGGPSGTGPLVQRKQDLPTGVSPGYDSATDQIMNTPVHVMNPNGSPSATTVPFYEAHQKGLTIAPADVNQVQGMIYAAVQKDPNSPAGRIFQQTKIGMEGLPILTPDQEKSRLQNQNSNTTQVYAPSENQIGRTDPAILLDRARIDIDERAHELQLTNPIYRSDPNLANNVAHQQLIQEGVLPDNATVTKWRSYTTDMLNKAIGNPHVVNEIVQGRTKGFMGIPELKPPTHLSNTIAPQTPQTTQPPAGSLGQAPAGAVEGQTGTKGGRPFIVRNGFMMPQ
jgi:hypothetical protein